MDSILPLLSPELWDRSSGVTTIRYIVGAPGEILGPWIDELLESQSASANVLSPAARHIGAHVSQVKDPTASKLDLSFIGTPPFLFNLLTAIEERWPIAPIPRNPPFPSRPDSEEERAKPRPPVKRQRLTAPRTPGWQQKLEAWNRQEARGTPRYQIEVSVGVDHKRIKAWRIYRQRVAERQARADA